MFEKRKNDGNEETGKRYSKGNRQHKIDDLFNQSKERQNDARSQAQHTLESQSNRFLSFILFQAAKLIRTVPRIKEGVAIGEDDTTAIFHHFVRYSANRVRTNGWRQYIVGIGHQVGHRHIESVYACVGRHEGSKLVGCRVNGVIGG